MALALASNRDVTVHVVHDERAAAFVALGIGLGGAPAVLLCTSGTAAANFHPAVVEAGLSGVPMLVLTADRPPELRDVGAPQTIDQTHLYGRSVALVPRPGRSRRRRRSDVAVAGVPRRATPRVDGPGAPQPAVPRAARRRARRRCRRALDARAQRSRPAGGRAPAVTDGDASSCVGATSIASGA